MSVAALAEFFVDVLVAFPVLLLWFTVVSVLVRPFGLRLPLIPFRWTKHRAAFQGFTFPQYLIVGGILCFGCGVLIASTLSGYLEWKYWHGPPLTSEKMVLDVVTWLLAGVLFGFISYDGNKD